MSMHCLAALQTVNADVVLALLTTVANRQSGASQTDKQTTTARVPVHVNEQRLGRSALEVTHAAGVHERVVRDCLRVPLPLSRHSRCLVHIQHEHTLLRSLHARNPASICEQVRQLAHQRSLRCCAGEAINNEVA